MRDLPNFLRINSSTTPSQVSATSSPGVHDTLTGRLTKATPGAGGSQQFLPSPKSVDLFETLARINPSWQAIVELGSGEIEVSATELLRQFRACMRRGASRR